MYKTASRFLQHSREKAADTDTRTKRLSKDKLKGARCLKSYIKKWRKIAKETRSGKRQAKNPETIAAISNRQNK
jgi:hypothetical protein